MYYYKIYDYDYSLKLTHEELFDTKEFKRMCKETPVEEYGFYTLSCVKNYLVQRYGFKVVEDRFVASFDIESE